MRQEFGIQKNREYNIYEKWLVFLLCCQQFQEGEDYVIDQKEVFALLTGASQSDVEEVAENACAQGHTNLSDPDEDEID